MASFPTSIITTATLVTPTANQPTNNPSHSGAHVLINGEIIAVETALGTNPQGSYATVSAALTTHGTLITAAQTTASSALTIATAAQTTANTAATAASAAQSTANTAVTLANAAQTTANTAVTLANTAQTTANARATYPGAGIPLSTGSAWGTSYTAGTAANNIVQLTAASILPSTLIGVQTFTASGTFTAPTGITQVYLTMIGGGAGGGTGNSGSGFNGGGGGAGAYVINYPFTVVPGSPYTVTIGAGGAADTNGGDTSFSTVTVKGGTKGANGSTTSNGGAGGAGFLNNLITDVSGTPTSSAFAGQNGYKAGGGGAGGAGASSLYGQGGTPVNGVTGGNATGYGAAGGGGSQGSSIAGGTGSGGICLVQW